MAFFPSASASAGSSGLDWIESTTRLDECCFYYITSSSSLRDATGADHDARASLRYASTSRDLFVRPSRNPEPNRPDEPNRTDHSFVRASRLTKLMVFCFPFTQRHPARLALARGSPRFVSPRSRPRFDRSSLRYVCLRAKND